MKISFNKFQEELKIFRISVVSYWTNFQPNWVINFQKFYQRFQIIPNKTQTGRPIYKYFAYLKRKISIFTRTLLRNYLAIDKIQLKFGYKTRLTYFFSYRPTHLNSKKVDQPKPLCLIPSLTNEKKCAIDQSKTRYKCFMTNHFIFEMGFDRFIANI